ncbi:hypothetical protein ECZU34_34200 [Escherichia coli]|nr:hypothetical protein ECZU34_34200 [Escherichia coli]
MSEAGAGITISGTTTAQAGQTLTVTLNNNTYQTTILADGTWSVNVPATDLSGLTASSYTVTATVSDKASNRQAPIMRWRWTLPLRISPLTPSRAMTSSTLSNTGRRWW